MQCKARLGLIPSGKPTIKLGVVVVTQFGRGPPTNHNFPNIYIWNPDIELSLGHFTLHQFMVFSVTCVRVLLRATSHTSQDP